MTSGPSAMPSLPSVFASGTLAEPTRVNWRYRSDLALEHRVAPVAHVLEHQHPNHDIRRGALAPAGQTVRPARCQRVVDHLQQRRILQHPVDVPHPVFPKLTDFLGNKAVAEIKLATAQLKHVQAFLRALAR